MSGLPEGWAEAPLSELSDFNPKHDPGRLGETVSFVPMPAVDAATGTIGGATDRPLSEVWKGFTHFAEGDVIFAKITPCMENGKIAVARGLTNGLACGSTEFHVLRPNGALLADYLWRFLRQNSFRHEAERAMTGAVGQRRVPAHYLKAAELPVPPLAEQRRIVAKLDALTARTARARADLDRIPALAARYRQAILTRAFSGDLTAEWRSHLALTAVGETVTRIRSQRSADRKLARRCEVASEPDTELPATWSWVSPDEVADNTAYSLGIGPFGSNLVQADYRDSGKRLIFVRDIRRARFDHEGARYVTPEKASSLYQHTVSGGEVLITKMGDPPGDTALYPQDGDLAVITADCVKLKPHPELATAEFLVFAIRGDVVKDQLAEVTAGVAQQKISLERFRKIALPIPPLDEQLEIVRRIESAFAEIDRLTAEAAAARRLLDRLDEAVLAEAFRGELVPQDPADEPASVLLERIRAERAAAPKSKRARRKAAA